MFSLGTDEKKQHSMRLVYVSFAFLIAVLYDIFFWDKELGIGFLIFVSVYATGFVALAYTTKRFRQPWSLLLLLPIVVMSLDVALYNNSLVQYFVPTIVALCLFIFSVLLTYHNADKHPFSFLHIHFFRNLWWPLGEFKTMYQDVFRWGRDDRGVYKKIAIGLGISFPLLIIFSTLFFQADAIFADWMLKLFDIHINGASVWRVIRTVAVTAVLGSILYVLASDKHQLSIKVRSIFRFDTTVVSTILALVNALFLLFVFIQVKYLFGSASYVFANKLVFADYARQGFFELAWVMAIAAILLLFVYRSFASHGFPKAITALQSLLIVQVGVIAASALKRMNVYQDAYGYTVLRLYVEWFIYFVFALSILLLVSLIAQWSFRRFWHTGMAMSLLALTAVVSVNVDLVIAKQNVDRYINEHKELDMEYLHRLSIDAYPEIVRAFNAGFTYMHAEHIRGGYYNSYYPYNPKPTSTMYMASNRGSFPILDEMTAKEMTVQDLTKKYDSWSEWNRGVEVGKQAL